MFRFVHQKGQRQTRPPANLVRGVPTPQHVPPLSGEDTISKLVKCAATSSSLVQHVERLLLEQSWLSQEVSQEMFGAFYNFSVGLHAALCRLSPQVEPLAPILRPLTQEIATGQVESPLQPLQEESTKGNVRDVSASCDDAAAASSAIKTVVLTKDPPSASPRWPSTPLTLTAAATKKTFDRLEYATVDANAAAVDANAADGDVAAALNAEAEKVADERAGIDGILTPLPWLPPASPQVSPPPPSPELREPERKRARAQPEDHEDAEPERKRARANPPSTLQESDDHARPQCRGKVLKPRRRSPRKSKQSVHYKPGEKHIERRPDPQPIASPRAAAVADRTNRQNKPTIVPAEGFPGGWMKKIWAPRPVVHSKYTGAGMQEIITYVSPSCQEFFSLQTAMKNAFPTANTQQAVYYARGNRGTYNDDVVTMGLELYAESPECLEGLDLSRPATDEDFDDFALA
jgi:hypothetical protein